MEKKNKQKVLIVGKGSNSTKIQELAEKYNVKVVSDPDELDKEDLGLIDYSYPTLDAAQDALFPETKKTKVSDTPCNSRHHYIETKVKVAEGEGGTMYRSVWKCKYCPKEL